jgi:hypothetical protein
MNLLKSLLKAPYPLPPNQMTGTSLLPKRLLDAMKTPSPPPEQVRHGLANLYDNIFSTHEEYREFAANHLAQWGNTLDYKLFDTLYLTHRYHTRTKKFTGTSQTVIGRS